MSVAMTLYSIVGIVYIAIVIFSGAFAALKDSSLYEAAQDVPLIDPKETRPLQPATKAHSQNSIIVSSRQVNWACCCWVAKGLTSAPLRNEMEVK